MAGRCHFQILCCWTCGPCKWNLVIEKFFKMHAVFSFYSCLGRLACSSNNSLHQDPVAIQDFGQDPLLFRILIPIPFLLRILVRILFLFRILILIPFLFRILFRILVLSRILIPVLFLFRILSRILFLHMIFTRAEVYYGFHLFLFTNGG